MAPGSIQSTGQIFMRLRKSKFFSLTTGNIPVTKANICVDCGFVEMIGDIRKAQTLTGKIKPV